MQNRKLALFILLLAMLLPASPAFGADDFDFLAYERERSAAQASLQAAQQECMALRGQLEAAGVPAPPELQTDYLRSALDLLHAGLQYQYTVQQNLPLVMLPAATQGWLANWPGNPLDGWRPIRVLRPQDGFSPGDAAWELPPAEHYSLGWGRLQPLSYQLYIYGDDPAAATPAVLDENAAWATPPAGALYAAGSTAPPFSVQPPAEPTLEALLELAQDEVFKRDLALEWAAHRLKADDAQSATWLLRSLDPQLRAARVVDKLAQSLRGKPRADWTAAELEAYQQQALWLVLQGFNNATWAGGGGEQLDWRELRTQGLLPYWPGNPYADWRPMELRDPAAGFAAGDLVLLRAPAYYAQVGAAFNLSGSYELGVYGATPQSQSAAGSPVNKMNIWAQLPPGVVACQGVVAAPQAAQEFNRALCHS